MEYRILGPLEIVRDGQALALRGDRQRALLCLLLLSANEVVSSDRLLEDLWGEEQPAAGLKALRVQVSRLRKTLGAALETEGHGYRLRLEPGDLDLERFRALVEEARGQEAKQASETLHEG